MTAEATAGSFMRFDSITGKLVQLGQVRPALWWPFVAGWLRRHRNGFVPCAVAGCKGLLNVPLEDFYVSYGFFCEQSQGRRELNFFLGKLGAGETFYDIGGFHGAYSVIAKLKWRDNIIIHAFEPLAKNVESIRRICALNHFTGIQINALAVGDGNAVTGGVNEQDAMLRLGDSRATVSAIEFPSISLDEYVGRGAPVPTVIKIDVDGFELHVLRGARECLQKNHPRLWLEVHPEFLSAQKKSPEEVLDLLRETGYKILLFDDFNSPNSKFSYHVWCE